LLSLNGLTTLDAATARALSKHEGELYLDGLTALSVEAAEALAKHQHELNLCGLTALCAKAAKALTQHKAFLTLKGLTTLSAEAANALAAADGWDGALPKLTALDSPDSVAIAKALATREGRLSLPNLKRASPKTLTALIEKRDVEIPLIVTLELIPEPDGSTTDRVVLPEWLEERQKQQRAEQQPK
jgi:hypothetical protein